METLDDDRHASTEDRPRCRGVVLLADDTADTCALYSLYLTYRGFRVLTATDGEAAVEMALRHRPDVVVMDFAMPRLDGEAATQRLRADARTACTPVIMLTANPLAAAQRGALAAGLDGFLTKPCLPEALERHIESVIGDRAGAQREPLLLSN